MNPVIVFLVAAVALLLLVNAAWGRRRKPAAPGRYVSAAGRRIHFREHPGASVPVVFLHGMPGTHLDFERVVAQLPDLHMIVIDRPGYGWSEGGPLPYREQIDLVPSMLQAMGIARAVLVGHSFGGLLALGVARMHPDVVESLVLVAPSGGGLRSGRFRLAAARMALAMQVPVLRHMINVTVGGITRRLSAEIDLRFAFGPDPVDPVYRSRLNRLTLHDDNLRAMADDRLAYDSNIVWIDQQVPDIDVPSAIILAKGDRPIPIKHGRRLAAALRGTRVVEVPGGHMIPFTLPGVIAGEVRRAVDTAAGRVTP